MTVDCRDKLINLQILSLFTFRAVQQDFTLLKQRRGVTDLE